jgi:hypothetical protein
MKLKLRKKFSYRLSIIIKLNSKTKNEFKISRQIKV